MYVLMYLILVGVMYLLPMYLSLRPPTELQDDSPREGDDGTLQLDLQFLKRSYEMQMCSTRLTPVLAHKHRATLPI